MPTTGKRKHRTAARKLTTPRTVTDAHRALGFIPDPDPAAWTHLPLMRTSERTTFSRCPQAWQWSYVERIGRVHTGNALKFGSMVHKALEVYYPPGKKRGPHPVKTFLAEYDAAAKEAGYDFGVRDEDEEWADARELGEEMLGNYVDHWKVKDKAWDVVAPEQAAMVVVLSKTGKPMCRYLMQLDLVVHDNSVGRYLFVDHKTAKSLHEPEDKALDEQCGTYWLFGPAFLETNGVIPDGSVISGFLYNVLRKGFQDQRPRNAQGHYLNKPAKDALVRAVAATGVAKGAAAKMTVDALSEHLRAKGMDPAQLGEVSKQQPPPLFQRFNVYADQARRDNVLHRIRVQLHKMELTRRGKLGVDKVPMFGGMGACTMCEFYAPCLLQEDGADYEALMEMDYAPSDPYEQYREELDISEDL